MNRRWLFGLVGLICLGTVGYNAVSIVAATPEEILRRSFSCPGESKAEAKDFQVLTVRKWEKGIVALARGQCPGEASTFQKESSLQPVLNYRVVKRQGMEWNLTGTGSALSQNFEKSKSGKSNKKLIQYNVGRTEPKAKEKHTVFYGEILSPSVASVEVAFDNGKVLRDTGVDGMLLLVAPGATAICDVRALGVDHQILQRDEPIPVRSTSGMNTCQPISGQL